MAEYQLLSGYKEFMMGEIVSDEVFDEGDLEEMLEMGIVRPAPEDAPAPKEKKKK